MRQWTTPKVLSMGFQVLHSGFLYDLIAFLRDSPNHMFASLIGTNTATVSFKWSLPLATRVSTVVILLAPLGSTDCWSLCWHPELFGYFHRNDLLVSSLNLYYSFKSRYWYWNFSSAFHLEPEDQVVQVHTPSCLIITQNYHSLFWPSMLSCTKQNRV